MNNQTEINIVFCSATLDVIKEEFDKRDVLYANGVDLSNYQNNLYKTTLDCLCYIIGGTIDTAKHDIIKEHIEWWLFEDVEKIIYIDSDTEYNVTSSHDLIRWIYNDIRG